ncbi:MAG: ComF family protein [Candidatus Aminicenantia bacterium]
MVEAFSKKIFRKLGNLGEIIFFPSRCQLCSAFLELPEEKIICQFCWEQLKPLSGSVCLCCGKLLKSTLPSHLCQECLTKIPPFSIHRSVGEYEGILKEIILLFKYHQKKILGKNLAHFAYHFLQREEELLNVEGIVSVPLHPKKKKERGFNQTEIIARELTRLTHKEFIKGALIKVKNTLPQSQLEFKERERNIKGAFSVKNREKIEGKNLLLVDDVFTSGSTIKECAFILLKAGAKEVKAFTLAQAGL